MYKRQGLSTAQVAEMVSPSVVVITTEQVVYYQWSWYGQSQVESGAGSGVIISSVSYTHLPLGQRMACLHPGGLQCLRRCPRSDLYGGRRDGDKEMCIRDRPFELNADSVEILGDCPADEYPLQKKKMSMEYLRTMPTLRPRTNTFNAAFRVRSVAAYAIHKLSLIHI